MSNRRSPRRWLAAIAALAIVAGGLLAFAPAAPAQAVSTNTFQAGNIISDQNFFDPNAMSVAQIQAFLNSKITGCTTGNCLNVLTVNTTTRAASYSPQGYLVCNPYIGAVGESAATVIFKVQQACSVSAKAILVTLQKEQGLVTKNTVSAATLGRAMGYGCPDSANGACDALYYGFYNQVYNGARQLRRYGTTSPVGNYQPGVKYILYTPNAVACVGARAGSNVNILNRATAALYNYTPYQPNGPALANINGTGDECSSYGNRNFWRYYDQWFGDPTVPAGTPEANLDAIPSEVGKISISGWAVDPDAPTTAVPVAVKIDQTWFALSANGTGADLSAQYAGAGTDHYFSASYPVGPGNHALCIWVENAGGVGGEGSLGCQTVAVPWTPTPLGGITAATAAHGIVSFSGWAARPDNPTVSVNLATQYNSVWTGYSTGLPNAAAVTAVPGAGPNQGFAGSFAAPPGPQTFCLWAGPTLGPAVQIGCTTVVVPPPTPAVTHIDSVAGGPGAITASGWAVYPETPTTPVNMALQISGTWYSMTANRPSSEPQATVPGAGPNQGFQTTVALPPGIYGVCTWVTEPAGDAANLGCQTVTVTAVLPMQTHIDSIAGTSSGISVAGWAIWPDKLTSNVNMAVQVGSAWYDMTANGVSATGAAAVAGAGPNHGFASTIPAGRGTYQVCLWAGLSSGGATNIGCQNVTVAATPPTQSHIDAITGGVGTVTVSGWAVWPDKLSSSVNMAIQVGNSSWTAMTANSASTAAATAVVGAGPNHGFTGSVALSPGTYPVCVWAGTSAGPATNIGCQTVTVLAVPPVQAHIDSITSGTGTVSVAGWAVWPDKLSTSVNMAVQIDATWYPMTANTANAAAATAVAGAGTSHGFSQTQSFVRGTHQVCVWAGLSAGGAVDLGCQNVTVH